MDILKWAKLTPLLSKRIHDLTLGDLQLATDTFDVGITMTEELKSGVLALLQGANIDSVADLIKSPQSLQQLLSFVRPQADSQHEQSVVQCPHCEQFFLY